MTLPGSYFIFVSLQELFRGHQGHLLGLESPVVFLTATIPAREAQARRNVSIMVFFSQHWDGLWSIFPGFLRLVAMTQKPLVP